MGKWRYGVILDAGSSGTRLHIYKWLNVQRARHDADEEDIHSLPEIETERKYTKKIHPGVSTFGETPTLVGPDHLKPLFDHALKYVPKSQYENTPIFLLATAGVRLLPAPQRTALLKEICNYAKQNTPFQLPDCDLHIQAIPGATEGLYGWIAANYLLGGFDHPKEHDHGKGHHTYGFLDMGGASAQIAFAPNSTEAEKHAEDLQLLRLRTLDGQSQEYRVFVTTWLEFGVNEARRRYVKHLTQSVDQGATEIPDPCLPTGLKVTTDGKPVEEESATPHLLGTGKFSECIKAVFPLLDKDAPCPDSPCLFNGVHVPAIDFDVNHFIGVSEYWHTTHQIFEHKHEDKAYDYHTYQDRVNEFCTQSWDTIEKGVEGKKWGKKVDETTALEVCFKASWLINVLHEGIGVPRVGIEGLGGKHNGTKEVLGGAKEKCYLNPFQAVNKIDDTEVSWTLGRMVLYASSQVPPMTGQLAKAVGHGENKGILGDGITDGWQFGGGRPIDLPVDMKDDDDDDGGDWHDKLFEDSPRRIPGILLFLLIVCVALYLLCGRDRRAALSTKLRSLFGGGGSPSSGSRRRRGGGGGILGAGNKLFGGSSHPAGPTYDRLEAGPHPDDFELGDLDSDPEAHDDPRDRSGSSGAESLDSNSPKVGRSSGWATPQLVTQQSLTASSLDTSPPKRSAGYFGSSASLSLQNSNTHGFGLGLGSPNMFGNPIERFGVVSRTESREKLAPQHTVALPRMKSGGFTTPARGWSPVLMKEAVE
ncbi:hypothetical protein K402DRAFT_350973 [Aulographum hederae CBS 113979]|uniref:Nucleoside diphosphatase n=1 Tax=Aulographum hederae CBS 113979 TaxID=1176131 RepID=A0A6G1H816_9PEZI|nr:hypothetical protein K402DRAFT_350973 [Aulographum hederae CBS 113979]